MSAINPRTILSDRVTVPQLRARKSGASDLASSPKKIAAITAYDYSMARLVDSAGVDLILIGDSLACVVQGEPNTLPATLDQMIYHCRCVTRGTARALTVGDLPFMSYQVSIEQGMESACKMIKEGGVAAVKLEGGRAVLPLISRLTDFDIPVVGHVGLTPQSYHRMGGHKQQGRSHASGSRREAGTREAILEDARAVAEAGAFAVVLEAIPSDLAREVTEQLDIPTIGIGAGPYCDGQILVINDLLGMDPDFAPSFCKRYAEVGALITEAVSSYVSETRSGAFPVVKAQKLAKLPLAS